MGAASSEILRPGVTLYVYGIKERIVELEGVELPLVATLDDGDWSYLVCSNPCDELIARLGLVVGYQASLPYEQWLDGDMSSPISAVGLTIVPPWCELDAHGREDVLVIEPGLAFGTGAHPTTRRCLEVMAALLRGHSIARVLDLGCGTGLLGLVALRLGAEETIGCDTSGHALEVARRNAHRNGLAARATYIEARAAEVAERGELVLANLPPSALGELVDHRCFGSCRWVIVSGMLASDLKRVVEGMPRDFSLVEAHLDGFWNTALFGRRG